MLRHKILKSWRKENEGTININSTIILININLETESTFSIFNHYVYIGGLNTVECHFNNYNYYQYVTSPDITLEEDELWEIKRKEYENRLPFIKIDIRWMNVKMQDSSELKYKK